MHTRRFAIALALLAAAACTTTDRQEATTTTSTAAAPYRVDPFWPKPLKGNWILGQVAWVAVGPQDHVWVLHRPATLLDDEKGAMQRPPTSKCCTPAPPVIEFDPQGNVVRAWGGPGEGYDWPKNEHGIYVDKQGNVWIAGNDNADHQILKFTHEGKFLMQIGKPGKSEGSNSRTQLGRPAHMEVDAQANELFVADGYGNRRVIVFDSNTGTYKRHWGAYGTPPSDERMPAYSSGARPQQFGNVHCVHQARDNNLYVCDRTNDRIQVFTKQGTFLKEFYIEPQTLASGSAFDIAFSPDPAQTYIYVADGTNGEVHVLSREDGKKIGSFGRPGRMAGEFRTVHGMAMDSRGNIYTAEVGFGRRAQKFMRQQ